MSVGLIDSHIHLTDYEPGTDVSAIIERARFSGVTHLACNGTSENDWSKVLALSDANQGVIPFVGLHPWFVKDKSADWFSTLKGLVEANNCGIGETGLDKLAEPLCPIDKEEAFRAQLRLAYEYDRPITIHCVRAWGWLTDVLRTETDLPHRMLIHAYGGSPDMVKPLADLGAFFSFSGKVLDKTHEKARKSILSVPLDRLLIETDAPNMLPPDEFCTEIVQPRNGKGHNHPANLPAISDGIAEMLSVSPEALRERLWKNAENFFGGMLNRK